MTTKANQRHNESVYMELEAGDLVEFERGLYSHWAVYIGNGEVIHRYGEEDDGLGLVEGQHLFTISGRTFDKAVIRRDKFWDVVGNSKVSKNNSNDQIWKAYHPRDIVKRAVSKLGRVGYNLLYSNCEHFVNWCRYGMERSAQVDGPLGLGCIMAASLSPLLMGPVLHLRRLKEKKEKGSPY